MAYNCLETGDLTWRSRDRSYFETDAACEAWNSQFAGKPADKTT
jgi:hypothetical protein